MSSEPFILPSARSCTLYKPVKGTKSVDELPSVDLKSVTSSEIMLTTKDGQTIKAYLALPDVDTPLTTGIVILSDIFGCDSTVNRQIADRFASNSIPTILPDLFRGDPWPAKSLDETFAPWLAKHPFDRILSDAAVAVDALRERGFAKSLGMVGFCLGGGRVLDEVALAEKGLNPDAAVSFYGTRFDGAAVGSTAKCPIMYIAGEADPLVPIDGVHLLRETLETKNTLITDSEILITKDAGHAYVHRPKSNADKADSDTFLQKSVGWMLKHLATS